MINNYEFIFREKEEDLPGFPVARHIRYCADIHADEPWSVPLKEFVSFLGSIYGYDIREKIIIKSLLPDDFFETESPNQELTDKLQEEETNWEIFK
jgi:hypothetical protein